VTRRGWDQEAVLTGGLAAATATLVSGALLLAYARVAGGARRRTGQRQAPPAPGALPADRQQNVRAAAPR